MAYGNAQNGEYIEGSRVTKKGPPEVEMPLNEFTKKMNILCSLEGIIRGASSAVASNIQIQRIKRFLGIDWDIDNPLPEEYNSLIHAFSILYCLNEKIENGSTLQQTLQIEKNFISTFFQENEDPLSDWKDHVRELHAVIGALLTSRGSATKIIRNILNKLNGACTVINSLSFFKEEINYFGLELPSLKDDTDDIFLSRIKELVSAQITKGKIDKDKVDSIHDTFVREFINDYWPIINKLFRIERFYDGWSTIFQNHPDAGGEIKIIAERLERMGLLNAYLKQLLYTEIFPKLEKDLHVLIPFKDISLFSPKPENSKHINNNIGSEMMKARWFQQIQSLIPKSGIIDISLGYQYKETEIPSTVSVYQR